MTNLSVHANTFKISESVSANLSLTAFQYVQGFVHRNMLRMLTCNAVFLLFEDKSVNILYISILISNIVHRERESSHKEMMLGGFDNF